MWVGLDSFNLRTFEPKQRYRHLSSIRNSVSIADGNIFSVNFDTVLVLVSVQMFMTVLVLV